MYDHKYTAVYTITNAQLARISVNNNYILCTHEQGENSGLNTISNHLLCCLYKPIKDSLNLSDLAIRTVSKSLIPSADHFLSAETSPYSAAQTHRACKSQSILERIVFVRKLLPINNMKATTGWHVAQPPTSVSVCLSPAYLSVCVWNKLIPENVYPGHVTNKSRRIQSRIANIQWKINEAGGNIIQIFVRNLTR